jgi:hypothetical protein
VKRRILFEGRIVDVTDAELLQILHGDRYGGDRNRPYDGQPWTDHGVRGTNEVRGLTMRDIGDCIARGRVLATPLDGAEIDNNAAIQNALCEVERMMGIFPNVPKKPPAAIVGIERDDEDEA